MNKKIKGFSLAELLISLLIISIVLAAAVPTVTKRGKHDPEAIWNWAGRNDANSIFFGSGPGQGAIIGNAGIPLLGDVNGDGNKDVKDYFSSKYPLYSPSANIYGSTIFKDYIGDTYSNWGGTPSYSGVFNLNPGSFSTFGDRLSIVKKYADANNDMLTSHISFYNDHTTASDTEPNLRYAGRIASDEYNLAFGIGSLTNSSNIGYTNGQNEFRGYNTAIGHYALAKNTFGQYNTALGFGALNKTEVGYGNTAVGYFACDALGTNGDHNLCLGAHAGTDVETDPNKNSLRYNIRIGHPGWADGKSIISGFQQTHYRVGSYPPYYDRQLHINAPYFTVSTYNGVPVFSVLARPSDGTSHGYSDMISPKLTTNHAGTYLGNFVFTLKQEVTESGKILSSDLPLNLFLTSEDSDGDTNNDTVALIATTKQITHDNGLPNDSTFWDVYSGEDANLKIVADNVQMRNNTFEMRNFDGNRAFKINLNEDGKIILDAESNPIEFKSDDIIIPSLGYKEGKVGAAIGDLNDRVGILEGVPSDIRLKNVSGDSKAGLKEINALEVKNYTYKNDKEKTPHVGVIAQQLQKIFPNSVLKGKDGYLKIKTEEIFYAMVNSIKELFAQLQDLTAKIVGLDKRITELEQENATLKKQNEDFEKRLSKLEAKAGK